MKKQLLDVKKLNFVQYKLALIYCTIGLQECLKDPEIPNGLKAIYRQDIKNILAGKMSFDTIQRMHYFITGESIALLP